METYFESSCLGEKRREIFGFIECWQLGLERNPRKTAPTTVNTQQKPPGLISTRDKSMASVDRQELETQVSAKRLAAYSTNYPPYQVQIHDLMVRALLIKDCS